MILANVEVWTGFLSGSALKNLPANAGDIRYAGWIPVSGSSPGGGHGNPLEYSCLENPMEEEPGGLHKFHEGHRESDTTEVT